MITLQLYFSKNGRSRFEDWRLALDVQTRARVEARLQRFRRGNLGDHRHLGQGLCEARLHHGPGYRLYFGSQGARLILLLGGGDKSSQSRDLWQARYDWQQYKEEQHEDQKS